MQCKSYIQKLQSDQIYQNICNIILLINNLVSLLIFVIFITLSTRLYNCNPENSTVECSTFGGWNRLVDLGVYTNHRRSLVVVCCTYIHFQNCVFPNIIFIGLCDVDRALEIVSCDRSRQLRATSRTRLLFLLCSVTMANR